MKKYINRAAKWPWCTKPVFSFSKPYDISLQISHLSIWMVWCINIYTHTYMFQIPTFKLCLRKHVLSYSVSELNQDVKVSRCIMLHKPSFQLLKAFETQIFKYEDSSLPASKAWVCYCLCMMGHDPQTEATTTQIYNRKTSASKQEVNSPGQVEGEKQGGSTLFLFFSPKV